jgi:aspartate/methionine/tyrosine aminotransferase
MEPAEFRLERYFARWEFRARHLLGASDCETLAVRELLELAGEPAATLLDLHLGYTESQGDPVLRERVAAETGVAPDEIVTAVPEEAIFVFMSSLLRPGDRVVVQTPCYQSLAELARHRGCEVVPWPLVETDVTWRADLDALERLVTPGTRLVVVNAPHNPTGYLFTRAELDAVVALCEARGAWLFSDEMYRGLEEPERRLPPAVTLSPRAVSLSGLSKTHGLPGLRVGWLAVRDPALMAEIARWKDYTTICGSAPSEVLARVALACAGALAARSRAVIAGNRARMAAFLDEHPGFLAWREPAAGPGSFCRLLRGGAQAFADALVEATGVMAVPSTLFDFGDDHLRIGLGRVHFPLALSGLASYLRRDLPSR